MFEYFVTVATAHGHAPEDARKWSWKRLQLLAMFDQVRR